MSPDVFKKPLGTGLRGFGRGTRGGPGLSQVELIKVQLVEDSWDFNRTQNQLLRIKEFIR